MTEEEKIRVEDRMKAKAEKTTVFRRVFWCVMHRPRNTTRTRA